MDDLVELFRRFNGLPKKVAGVCLVVGCRKAGSSVGDTAEISV